MQPVDVQQPSGFQMGSGMQAISVAWAVLVASASLGHGGWWEASQPNETSTTTTFPVNETEAPKFDETWWSQAKDWFGTRQAEAGRFFADWSQWATSWGVPSPPPRRGLSIEGGLCLILDTIVGVVGWAVFGSAWPGVRSGCQRPFRLFALVALCMAAHYLWALCWPVISVVSAIAFGLIWMVRAMVRKLGTLVYLAQRATGGVPEATGADFIGPGTGRIPETADLRAFKKTGQQDKWVILRREGRVIVFKVGSDTQTIRSTGLYVPIEADSLRGDRDLLDMCLGVDKVHLCRGLQCGEDGQHFKEYCLAKDFDAEKFQLKDAELGAAKAGRTIWRWLWTTRRVPKPQAGREFGSESEPEPTLKCDAYQVSWAEDDQDVRLCKGPCKHENASLCKLLREDQVTPTGEVALCPAHALAYEQKRRSQGCKFEGCQCVGVKEVQGVRLCQVHAEERRSTPKKRATRSSALVCESVDSDEPDLPEPGTDTGRPRRRKSPGRASMGSKEGPRGNKTPPRTTPSHGALKRHKSPSRRADYEGDEEVNLESADPRNEKSGLRRMLEDSKGDSESEESRAKHAKSPGHTPKSSIHRNLARLGLLDSPEGFAGLPLLEDFFSQYAEGRDLGFSEEDVRRTLAKERGRTLGDVTRELFQQAVREQDRGQQGLSKFIRAWKRTASLQPTFGNAAFQENSSGTWELIGESGSGERPTVLTDKGSSTPATPSPLRIGNPSIFGQEDRKAGAAEPGSEGRMEQVAKAIESQTAEIAALVKSQTDSNSAPPGTLKGLGRVSEELVFLLRACNQYQVTIGAGEQGQALANALLSAQVGASTKLRKAGFKQKVTPRLAIGLAGPYWGTGDKHALTVADFVSHTDAELDAYVQEARLNKPGIDQKPAPPRIEEWEARARRQNEVWTLLYGAEWKPVRTLAVDLLIEWHQGEPHKWPLTVVAEIWEELHWRFIEELKETLRLLKKEANRETMTLPDIKFYALLPNSAGQAWLELPRTFDLRNPQGWFATEVLPRIERRQERMLWRLTWEGGRGPKPHSSAHAGGDSQGGGNEKPTLKGLWGPKLSNEEVNKAKDRAPTDGEGVLLCWGALTHMGCANQNCQRSHAGLKGKVEDLDPHVQMQLLRRGGLRRMRPETKETATEKIKKLRAAVAKDKNDKIADGRKSGHAANDGTEAADNTRAGGEKVVKFWEPPEKFEAIDYTLAERDMREKVKGPDVKWLVTNLEGGRQLEKADGQSAPREAQDLVERATALAQGPVLGRLSNVSDDLYAWAAAKVARNPNAGLEEILGEMATYGLGDMAAEALEVLEEDLGQRAGSSGTLQVKDTVWNGEGPGRGEVVIEGLTWIL